MRVFIGYDSRQPLAYNVARSSVERHATGRVQIEPLRLDWLPITRRGLTEFTFSRYLVPWLCDFRGPALFMDADTIVRADVRELQNIDPTAAVIVSQHVPVFERPSVMFFWCDNARCKVLTPEWIEDPANQPQTLAWAADRLNLFLPAEWNHCVGYADPLPPEAVKLWHFTAGVPIWPETFASPGAPLYHEELSALLKTCSWEELMGNSVHRGVVERLKAGSA